MDEIEWEERTDLNNTGYRPNSVIAGKTFCAKGKLFPRVSIIIREDRINETIKVECAVKEDRSAWWEGRGFPKSLLPVMHQMVADYLCRFSEGSAARDGFGRSGRRWRLAPKHALDEMGPLGPVVHLDCV